MIPIMIEVTPTRGQWRCELLRLSRMERAGQWQLGDLYLLGKKLFGTGWCKRIVEGPDWRGVEYPTLKVYASVCKRFPRGLRRLNASPFLHQLAAALPDDQALPLL